MEGRASRVPYVCLFVCFVFLSLFFFLICDLFAHFDHFWRTTAKTSEAFRLLDVIDSEMAVWAGGVSNLMYFLHYKISDDDDDEKKFFKNCICDL